MGGWGLGRPPKGRLKTEQGFIKWKGRNGNAQVKGLECGEAKREWEGVKMALVTEGEWWNRISYFLILLWKRIFNRKRLPLEMSIEKKKMFPKKKSWARENPESPVLTVRFDGDLKILGVSPFPLPGWLRFVPGWSCPPVHLLPRPALRFLHLFLLVFPPFSAS